MTRRNFISTATGQSFPWWHSDKGLRFTMFATIEPGWPSPNNPHRHRRTTPHSSSTEPSCHVSTRIGTRVRWHRTRIAFSVIPLSIVSYYWFYVMTLGVCSYSPSSYYIMSISISESLTTTKGFLLFLLLGVFGVVQGAPKGLVEGALLLNLFRGSMRDC